MTADEEEDVAGEDRALGFLAFLGRAETAARFEAAAAAERAETTARAATFAKLAVNRELARLKAEGVPAAQLGRVLGITPNAVNARTLTTEAPSADRDGKTRRSVDEWVSVAAAWTAAHDGARPGPDDTHDGARVGRWAARQALQARKSGPAYRASKRQYAALAELWGPDWWKTKDEQDDPKETPMANPSPDRVPDGR